MKRLCIGILVTLSFLIATGIAEEFTTELNANDLTVHLQEEGLPVTDIVVFDENTDPNGLLGRPGSYTSKTDFKDSRIDELALEQGGTIEVFSSTADCASRYRYLSAIYDASPIFRMYMYNYGNAILRVSYKLTPSKAEEYNVAMQNILSKEAKGEISATAYSPTAQEVKPVDNEVVSEKHIKVRKNGDVNVRSMPDADSKKVGIAKAATIYTLLDTAKNGWFYIQIDDGTKGYISPKMAVEVDY